MAGRGPPASAAIKKTKKPGPGSAGRKTGLERVASAGVFKTPRGKIDA